MTAESQSHAMLNEVSLNWIICIRVASRDNQAGFQAITNMLEHQSERIRMVLMGT